MSNELSPFEIECITKAVYEVHRQYCVMLGDNSHVSWDELDPELKRVALTATRGINDYNLSAEDSHKAWVSAKKGAGWTYGKTKNQAVKEHPCLVAFSELDPHQQAKDELWITVVKSMVATRWRMPQ